MSFSSGKAIKGIGWAAVVLFALYIVLLFPAPEPQLPELPDRQPFVWNQDSLWSALEVSFQQALQSDPASLEAAIDSGFELSNDLVKSRLSENVSPSDPAFEQLESRLFSLAPQLAAAPGRLPEYVDLLVNVRRTVKERSQEWDMNSAEARNTVYRLLYGGRTALEEIIMQQSGRPFPALISADDELSHTPACEILGATIHSGDLLVSRGGAPTSALIARGSDYPGNFSHVALVHVDSATGLASIIEAHIECGVAIADIDQYLADRKLRVLVLRLRSDHPALIADRMLPHKAAELALRRADSEHIPYDFEMDYHDPTKLFCSEVASAPYRQLGVQLWMGVSNISSTGVASWLAAFGVTHFETQEPSDLEYDPQLRVVAEWCNPETLWQDRVDNAVIDVMLEGAEQGDRLEYDPFMLPVARVMKGYSWVLNRIGKVGPVPEGMSAVAALRNDGFSKTHAEIKKRLLQQVREFESDHGYRPPYWELVALARTVAE